MLGGDVELDVGSKILLLEVEELVLDWEETEF